MMRGSSNEEIDRSLGLGPHLVGKQIDIHGLSLEICKQLGEGGFSFVYLVRTKVFGSDNNGGAIAFLNKTQKIIEGPQHSLPLTEKCMQAHSRSPLGNHMVVKITSVHNICQRHMAEKEAKLLQMLSHPSIVQVYDHGFHESHGVDENSSNTDTTTMSSRQIDISNPNNSSTSDWLNGNLLSSKLSQHLILMEYCEGGTAFDAIKRMQSSLPSLNPAPNNSNMYRRFDLPSLVISFGQICNAVSYLHAQRPPIIHRDLKPVNFLIKNGAYKLCDFGSAVLGHTDLRTPESRRKAEEVVIRTTTQMFRAPEMVDLYMSKRLTQSTDVWALGCCLYSLAFLCDCFEEGSNLAILSRKFKIPDDNPYGEGLVDLIDRMLAGDYKERADMSEVIMCLSALYSSRPLPKRRRPGRHRKEGKSGLRLGAYRTDGQGICEKACVTKKQKNTIGSKKLDPNSAAAKRKKASQGQNQNQYPPVSQASSNGDERIQFNSISHPSSVDDCVQNFASFDRVFEGNFDYSHIGSTLECGASKMFKDNFSSAFNEQCQVSVESSLQNSTDIRTNDVDGTFEVAFQSLSRASSHVTPTNHSIFRESCESFPNVRGSGSELPAYGSGPLENCEGSIGGKKKRGLFGIIGKNNSAKGCS